jgi:thiopurine S-methyltransferase
LTPQREKQRFLFPLCGKAVDMAWLASLGHTVVGIELAESALVQFFHEQKIEYNISQIDEFKVYKVKQQNCLGFFIGKKF